MPKSSLLKPIVLCLTGFIALTGLFTAGLSIAVNYGVAQFEQKAQDFLPAAAPDSTLQNP